MATRDEEEHDEIDYKSAAPTAGVGLCLSGGGYRAMLFHLGGLIRLNELGWLPKLTIVSSVSGGSITAGVLGTRWHQLAFDDTGVATNFDELVVEPLMAFAGNTVDVPSVLIGLLPGPTTSGQVQHAYDEHLFHGATMQDLPRRFPGPASCSSPRTCPTGRCGGSSRNTWATGSQDWSTTRRFRWPRR